LISALLIHPIGTIVSVRSHFLSVNAFLNCLPVFKILDQFFLHSSSGGLNCISMRIWESRYRFHMHSVEIFSLFGGISFLLHLFNIFAHHLNFFFFVSNSSLNLSFDIIMYIMKLLLLCLDSFIPLGLLRMLSFSHDSKILLQQSLFIFGTGLFLEIHFLSWSFAFLF